MDRAATARCASTRAHADYPSVPRPKPPPGDIGAVAPELRVAGSDLASARYLETYRGCELFALADGRIYLDGLIAVASLEHARATLDHLAQPSSDS